MSLEFKEIIKGYFWPSFSSFMDQGTFLRYVMKKYFQTWLVFRTPI